MTAAIRHLQNYAFLACLFGAAWIFSPIQEEFLTHAIPALGASGPMLAAFFEMLVIFIFGFLVYEVSKSTVIPSFVVCIFIGMIERGSLQPIVGNANMLTILTTFGAALILFGGGLDTPFGRFAKLIGPILAIAGIGTVVTALLFSHFLVNISAMLGSALPVAAAVILGAALASTDPAAIIPSLKPLVFKNARVKHIAVSESALNDVIGAVLTTVFLTLFTVVDVAEAPSTIREAYLHLFTAETGLEILYELLVGGGIGVLGFGILYGWNRIKRSIGGAPGEADAAMFLAVPLLCFVGATALHGSGFLAVFISSLLFQIEEHFRHIEHYFNHTIEAFMKPLIFMLLGASVDPALLMGSLKIGLIMGAVFVFIVRPIVVFLTIGPFHWGRHKISVKELLFLSFVRETGVIPAVLLIGIGASGIAGAETAVAIGLWVILFTLVLQPPLTPLLARLLGLATIALPIASAKSAGRVAVLGSRGLSFKERLARVIDWADLHGISRVILLHCPEDRYTGEFIIEMEKEAQSVFAAIRAERKKQEKEPIELELLLRPGTLQQNLEAVLRSYDVSMVFVGSKMLDYRLDEVKKLGAPFTFLA